MKRNRKILVVISAIILTSFSVSAQKGTLQMNLNYNYSIPIGAFKNDLVQDNSPRGARGSIMYAFNNQLSVGVESGYQDYYQKNPRHVYPLSGLQEVSAVVSNSIQTTPFLAKAKYLLFPAAPVRPYVSLGAGANMINFKQYLGEFGSGDTHIGFLGTAGIGAIIPFSKFGRSGINVGATFDYAPYKKNGYKSLNTVNLQAGVVFPIH